MDTLLSIGIAVLAVCAAAGWSLWYSARMKRPIVELQTTARRWAGGDLDARLELQGNGNLEELARDLNQLIELLRARRAEQPQASAEERPAAGARTMGGRDHTVEIVRTYTAFANEIALGNLSAHLNINGGQDELAQLGRNLNRVAEHVRGMTTQVQQASGNISSAAAEILAVATQQVAGAAEQSAIIGRASATVEEVRAIALQTAEEAGRPVQESQRTVVLEQAAGGMTQSKAPLESIAQRTQPLGIIASTVAGLAEQSSLLALNAAIEASRAGEQGSRLAGVAHQVRQVAERSKVAVEQMQEILNEAQPGTNSAVTVPGERATGTTPLAEQAADAARLVASGLESTAQANAHIAAAAQQQIAQIAQIGDALGTIQQATSESLAGTRKTEHAAQELTTLAQFLQHALTAYRV